MTTVEGLKKAKTKIKQGWCTGDLARTKDGSPTSVVYKDACSWDILGAIQHVAIEDSENIELLQNMTTAVRSKIPYLFSSIADFNDRSTKKKVLLFFDKVIKNLEAA